MKSDNRLLLAILAVALVLLLIVCCAGTVFVFFVYSSSNPGAVQIGSSIAATPRAVPAVPRARQGQTLTLCPLGGEEAPGRTANRRAAGRRRLGEIARVSHTRRSGRIN